MIIDAYLTITLNGMIALPSGDTPWPEDSWNAYIKLARAYPAIILGRATYDVMLAGEANDFEKMGEPRVLVISRKTKKIANKKHRLVPGPESAKAILRRMKIKKALVTGGAKTLSLFLKADLINRLIIDIEPQIFAKGMPLIDMPWQWRQTYKSVSVSRPSSKVVRIIYSKPADDD